MRHKWFSEGCIAFSQAWISLCNDNSSSWELESLGVSMAGIIKKKELIDVLVSARKDWKKKVLAASALSHLLLSLYSNTGWCAQEFTHCHWCHSTSHHSSFTSVCMTYKCVPKNLCILKTTEASMSNLSSLAMISSVHCTMTHITLPTLQSKSLAPIPSNTSQIIQEASSLSWIA